MQDKQTVFQCIFTCFSYFLLHSSFFLSLTAPTPQPVNLNPPMSTTVETICMNQQQSTRTTAFMNCMKPIIVQKHIYSLNRHIFLYQIHLNKHLSGVFFLSVTVNISGPSEEKQTGNTSHTAVYSDQEELGASKREGGTDKQM